MNKKYIFAALALLWLGPTLAQAAPQKMNYQGRLRQNIAGFPVVPDALGNTVTFNIWPTLTGGTVPLWTETYLGASNGVSTAGGLFNVALGSVNPINLPFDQPYFLEIVWTNSVGAQETMAPRQPLLTAPYAFHASYADSVVAPENLTGSVASPGAVLSVSNVGTGYGLLAASGVGGQAMEVQGGARFDIQGGPTSVTFNTDVFFNGVVHGISGSVPNPLLLSSSTITGPVIEGTNTHVGGGIGLEGSTNSGLAIMALAGSGQALFADATSSTDTAVQVQNDSSGDGIDSFSAGLVHHLSGLYGEDDSTNASPNAGFGVTGYSGNGTGVFGESSDSTGGEAGLWGQADATSGPSNAVVGDGSASNGGTGVWGMGGAYGVYGSTSKGTGSGVYGTNGATGGATGYGTYGIANVGSSGIGAYGNGSLYGVQGAAGSTNAYAVYGSNFSLSSSASAVYGLMAGSPNGGNGVEGANSGSGNTGTGVFGHNSSANGIGVYALNNGGGLALQVQGNANFSSGSTVNFNGATILNFNGNVATPLSLTANSGGPTIRGTNTASGAGLAATGLFYGLTATANFSTTGVVAAVSGTATNLGGSGNAGFGVYGSASSASGIVYGTYGESSSSNGIGAAGAAGAPTGYGVEAINTSATAASGAALYVKGTVAVQANAFSDSSSTGAPAGLGTLGVSSGHINFLQAKTIAVNGSYGPIPVSSVLSNKSIVLVTFSSAAATAFTASAVVNPAGTSFTVNFFTNSAQVNFSIGDGMSFLIINQQ